MHPAILALMAAQQGLVTRPQALANGLDPDALSRLVRSGAWTPVRRGVYADSELVRLAVQDYRRRRLLTDRAASLKITADHVASHDFAALELDLPLVHPLREFSHVTRPRVVGTHLRHGVKHHLAPFRDRDVVEVAGRRVLSPARTALDLAREHGNPTGVVAVDAARARGASIGEFEDILSRMHCWPETFTMTEAVNLSDAGADTILETLVRLMLWEMGWGPIQTQFGLTDGDRTAWIDLRVGRHLIECDGRVKYQRADEFRRGRTTSPEEVVWEEKRRQDFACGFELGMSRVVWDDVWGPARVRTMQRLEREKAATDARYGTDISDLARFRPRGPRPRPWQ